MYSRAQQVPFDTITNIDDIDKLDNYFALQIDSFSYYNIAIF